jgi:hypothetical protein
VDVPKYPELSVDKIWPKVADMPDVSIYFPNYSQKQFPQREYLWNVLFTIRPEGVCTLIQKARENRSVSSSPSSEELVDIAPDLLQRLKELRPQKRRLLQM